MLVAQAETQVLKEYATVAANLDELANLVQKLSAAPPQILNEIRPLERKLGLVLTLFKASVWALLVQREEENQAADETY